MPVPCCSTCSGSRNAFETWTSIGATPSPMLDALPRPPSPTARWMQRAGCSTAP